MPYFIHKMPEILKKGSYSAVTALAFIEYRLLWLVCSFGKFTAFGGYPFHSPLHLELRLYQPVINPLPRHQLVMRTHLRNMVIVDNHQSVRVL